jgi:hypothetical protein
MTPSKTEASNEELIEALTRELYIGRIMLRTSLYDLTGSSCAVAIDLRDKCRQLAVAYYQNK